MILPGITACIDCTLDFYPPQVCFALPLVVFLNIHVGHGIIIMFFRSVARIFWKGGGGATQGAKRPVI